MAASADPQASGKVQFTFKEVAEEEKALLKQRRKKRQESPEDKVWFTDEGNLFGIALSGGGVRSATLSLGFTQVLYKAGLLTQADYLSTVSGGGYLGAYIQSRFAPDGGARAAFSDADIQYLRQKGGYLALGKGLGGKLRLGIAYLVSVLLNLVPLLLFGVSIWRLFVCLGAIVFGSQSGPPPSLAFCAVAVIAIGLSVGLWHLGAGSGILPVRYSPRFLYWLEAALVPAVVVSGLILCLSSPTFCAVLREQLMSLGGPWRALGHVLAPLVLSVLAGFFANPNRLGIRRFYQDRLQSAFLEDGHGWNRNRELHRLDAEAFTERNAAPYPLINTCLNLTGDDGQGRSSAFAGAKTCDYFLLSPLFCGSKLTRYVPSSGQQYQDMDLATAMTISGAALNTGMGIHSLGFLSMLMTLLGIRLGYWAPNPLEADRQWKLPFWPNYQWIEAFSQMNLSQPLVNLSDGGHIENLGVFELLRRRCRLIVALDAGADPNYEFSDLENLVQRARNELGLAIDFCQAPECYIRPMPSVGFSDSHFVIAKVTALPGTLPADDMYGYDGLLVYVKSSVRRQVEYHHMDMSQNQSLAYKLYHPAFPHESTLDQFFVPEQWTAYHVLGCHIAGDLLGARVALSRGQLETSPMTVTEFVKRIRDLANGDQALREDLDAANQTLTT